MAPPMTPEALNVLIHRDFASARRGNVRAYERIVVATQRMVASVALAVTRDVHASEDIAQDTFLRAWQHLGQLENPDSVLPWLRHVARNRAIDHVRTRRPAVTVDELVETGPGPEQSLLRQQQADALAQALDAIPDQSREVLLLFYREGESSQAVAGLLGLSDAAVRKRLQRARDCLKSDVLRRLGEVAASSAPGVLFTMAVATGVALGPTPAAATGLAAGVVVNSAPKLVLATLGALAASVAVVIAGVVWDIRASLAKVSDPRKRRALLVNGVVYGVLMSGYMVALSWMPQHGWSVAHLFAVAILVALLVIALSVHRARIVRGTRDDSESKKN